jgi:hypothetical protein
MAKNKEFPEPPVFKGNLEEWALNTARFLRTLYDDIYGLTSSGGELDGIDNIVSAEDPGVADGTASGNATVINQLVTNLKATGIVKT